MREYRYTTPHGIQVTRTDLAGHLPAGVCGTCCGNWTSTVGSIFLPDTSIPGGTRAGTSPPSVPPLEIVAWDRRVEVPPAQPARRVLARMLHPVLAGHPHWEEFAFEGDGLARPPEAVARAVPRRGAQQAALGLFHSARADRGVPRARRIRASRWSAPSATTCCSSSIRSKSSLPRHGHKDLHLFLCDDIYFMDRKKEQIERYQYDFERDGETTRGLARERRGHRRAARLRARRHRSPTTRPKSTWPTSRRCARACAAAITTRWCCARRFSAPYSGSASELVRAHPGRQPQPVRVPPAVRRRAVDRRVARNVRARGRPARRDLPDLRHRAAHRRPAARCREHRRAARIRSRKSPS